MGSIILIVTYLLVILFQIWDPNKATYLVNSLLEKCGLVKTFDSLIFKYI